MNIFINLIPRRSWIASARKLYSALARQNDGQALALRGEASFCLDFLVLFGLSKKKRNYCKVNIGVFILVVAKESNN